MISAGREAVIGLFGEGAIREFVEEVVGLFAASKLPVPVIYNDNTAKLYYLLRIFMTGTSFSKLVQSYIAVCPHSCGPERAVSCYTQFWKVRNNLDIQRKDLTAGCMCIAMNSTGTANFDPRPAVAKFLQKKDRRNKFPTELQTTRIDNLSKSFLVTKLYNTISYGSFILTIRPILYQIYGVSRCFIEN